MTPLSPRQREVMLYIQRAFAQTGQAPTLVDITVACKLASKSRAHAVVEELCDAGLLAKQQNRARGLVILRTVPDDRFEDAARKVCEALRVGATPDNIARAREAIVSNLIDRSAA